MTAPARNELEMKPFLQTPVCVSERNIEVKSCVTKEEVKFVPGVKIASTFSETMNEEVSESSWRF